MASNSGKQDKKSSKGPSPEDILNGFQTLRAEQRALSGKLSEFELDLNEHRMVIETLKNVNEDRKCFRLVGGVLTERKVKDVLPVLITNQEKLKEIIEKLNEQIGKKGQEINEYREKHNIRFRGLDNVKQEEQPVAAASESRGNVLVS
ncbi:prefoldin subunit 2 [Anoplophora glabripennis]|uniref:Prefoldin subunit n=1 Tax=Anoplophora glabripennis TaxID=217634 RepID=V5IAN6_ANOGL|nr:prefoldin subunit 2 [Anoplophora glabripennis]